MKPRQRSSIQKLFPKPFSLIFQTLMKTPKRLFNLNPKTSFNCCENTREQGKIRKKNLGEKLFPMGYLQPPEKYSRWQQKKPEMNCRSTGPVDRPTVNFCPLAAHGRPARSTQTNRELCSQTRSTLTVDHPCLPNVHRSVHVGRPTRSTEFNPSRLGQKTSRLVEGWNRKLGQKNCLKIF